MMLVPYRRRDRPWTEWPDLGKKGMVAVTMPAKRMQSLDREMARLNALEYEGHFADQNKYTDALSDEHKEYKDLRYESFKPAWSIVGHPTVPTMRAIL